MLNMEPEILRSGVLEAEFVIILSALAYQDFPILNQKPIKGLALHYIGTRLLDETGRQILLHFPQDFKIIAALNRF